MGLRHVVVVNAAHVVTGIVTRQDITKERLGHHWFIEVKWTAKGSGGMEWLCPLPLYILRKEYTCTFFT